MFGGIVHVSAFDVSACLESLADSERSSGTAVMRLSRRFLMGAAALVVPLFVLAPAAGVSAATISPAASVHLSRVGVAPQVPIGAHAIGAVAPTTTETGAVVLQPRDEAALTQFIAEVTNKTSPMYHQYLAPGAFAGQFGPTPATVAAVTAQLASDGLNVTGVATDGLLVSFSGSAAAVESAFHTGLSSYRLADGRIGQTTTSAVSLPSTIATVVSGVVGLDSLVRAQPMGLLRAPVSKLGTYPAAIGGTTPAVAQAPAACSAAQTAAQSSGGLTDNQIANAYGAFGLYGQGDLGKGQTIAVYELESFLPSDINTFDSCYFGATQAATMAGQLHVIPVDGGQPAGPGSGEAVLDVEDVSALAPAATIDVYEAPNTSFGGLDEYSTIINSDQAKVVTTSWGLCEQAVQVGEPGVQQAENFLFQQAAAQGQSVFAAAGDTGVDDCNAFRAPAPPAGQNPLSVDDPGSQPYVISVGGTTIDNATTQPPAEHVWNDGAQWGAGGGGISESWGMPSWQQSLLQSDATNATDVANAQTEEQALSGLAAPYGTPYFCQSTLSPPPTACREVPDVSAQADEFTGAITIYSQAFGAGNSGWITIGGTSSATPIWAASLALVNASPSCSTTGGVGFVSPLLYGVASNPTAYAASFTDVTQGNNDIYGLANGLVFPAHPGYDMASGLGSPQLTGPGGTDGLAYYLCNYAPRLASPAVISGINPTSGSTAGGTLVTITGRGFTTSQGVPDVSGIQIGSAQVPSFTVVNNNKITFTTPVATTTTPPTSPNPTQDGAGPANVVVTLTDGLSSKVGPGATFEYVDMSGAAASVPSVTGVSPYGGSEQTPKPVTIFGSGFTSGDTVTFGGVGAYNVSVKSDYEITATPPAYSGVASACAPLPSAYAGENGANDICQLQVVVTGSNGSSQTSQILPPYEGPALPVTPAGVAVLPGNCGCEFMPAPSEYDYVPNPTVTSVSTTAGGAALASETGGSVVTITGTGFNPMTMAWVDFGPTSLASSTDTSISYETGTVLQITAPAQAQTVDMLSVPVAVNTLAGLSTPANSGTAYYAGIPQVTSVTDANPTTVNGLSGALDTGGTQVTVAGSGFTGGNLPGGPAVAQTLYLVFNDYDNPFSTGTQYNFNIQGNDTTLTADTVSQNPGIVDVQACTVSGCSLNPPADEMLLYPPGSPDVTGVSPASGSTAGGGTVTISGANLGCVTGVSFGTVAATTFSNVPGFLDCGSTSAVTATVPAAAAAGPVTVSVTTAETAFSGKSGTSTATYTYLPPSTPPSSPPPSGPPGSPPPGPAASGSATGYTPETPVRICDTRSGNPSQLSGAVAQCNGATLAGGTPLNVNVAGLAGVPATGATAVVLNVTVTNPSSGGYLTVYPAGQAAPLASSLNFAKGQTVANSVEVGLGSGGQIAVVTNAASVNVIIDVEGYFSAQSNPGAGLYNGLAPSRICDTRGGSADQCTGHTMGPGSTMTVQVTGLAGVPANAIAAVLNVTATDTTAAGYLTVYPAGTRPTTSNLNWAEGSTVANSVVAQLNSGGAVTLYNSSGSTDVVIDVSGYYTAAGGTGTQFTPLATPVRICDTRAGSGDQCTGHTMTAGSTLAVQVTGVAGVPSDATAVVINVTATNTSSSGYLTIFPSGPTPVASSVNWIAGMTVPNLVIATLNSKGGLTVYNSAGSTDVVIDVLGYYS